ncbi:hypothetical protein [Streptomyces sp. NPDC019507]|uniref:hypothetical protein n=1 Tax=unclassified Streptomyces TaxID=2593676 RepID=UPI0034042A0D
MPRRWSLGVDRLHYDGIDGEYDRMKKTEKAHSVHDADRGRPTRSTGAVSGPTSSDASTPQKRRWGRR